MPSFNVSKDDHFTILQIVNRVWEERPGYMYQTKLEAIMDLSAVAANGCPMHFDMLLMAPTEDFWHDILGIYRHLNRETGHLGDGFLPRYAKTEAPRAD